MSADKMAGFTKYQVASAIPLAAQNEGGMAGIGAGLGAGVTLGQVMGQALGSTLAPQAAPAAAPAAPAEDSIEARLEKLKGLMDKGLISAADYDSTKAELLKKLIG
jgi:membrane protease subunit (stomatin/prohibitin family)